MRRAAVRRVAAVACIAAMLLTIRTEALAQGAVPAGAVAARLPVAPPAEYRLSGGDIVRIVVFQSPDLTLETRVNEGGAVSFPLLGSVRLGGLTVTEAERVISDGLARGGFLRNPQVTVLVVQVRGSQASVLGQVNRPGRFPLETSDMRLTDLIALAGGVAGGGSDSVVLSGTRNGEALRKVLDLPSLFGSGGQSENLVVQNGDILWVDRQPIVYIYGEVQRPGPMRLERGMTLLQTLAAGGGPSARGTEKGIRLHRRNPEGKTVVLEPAMDDPVQDGDVVFVRESLF